MTEQVLVEAVGIPTETDWVCKFVTTPNLSIKKSNCGLSNQFIACNGNLADRNKCPYWNTPNLRPPLT